jgi:hypothetical protein
MGTFLLLQERRNKILINYKQAPSSAIKLTHSTRLSSPNGFDASTGFLPVMSSKRTTPKENTSDFSVNLPLDAYSGAMYLNKNQISEKYANVNYSHAQVSFYTYPKVPITRVVTCVAKSKASLASPKSAT